MSEREHMSQERMEAVRNNLDSFKFCASWFHNMLDEAQRLSREATALRQQRDTLREALRGLAGAYGVEFRKEGYVMLRVEEAALRRVDAALAQCDTQEGV